MYYVHKSNVLRVEQRDDEFTVYTLGGEQLGNPGDYFSSSLTGEQQMIPQEVFEEEYVAVEVISTSPSKKLSPFEEQYYQNAYEEIGKLDQEENKEYIENMRKLVENKPF